MLFERSYFETVENRNVDTLNAAGLVPTAKLILE